MTTGTTLLLNAAGIGIGVLVAIWMFNRELRNSDRKGGGALEAIRAEHERQLREMHEHYLEKLREREEWWRDQLRTVTETRRWIGDAKSVIEASRVELANKNGGK